MLRDGKSCLKGGKSCQERGESCQEGGKPCIDGGNFAKREGTLCEEGGKILPKKGGGGRDCLEGGTDGKTYLEERVILPRVNCPEGGGNLALREGEIFPRGSENPAKSVKREGEKLVQRDL